MSLVESVKRKLKVTYDDPDTNARIADIMAQAEIDLRQLLGINDEQFSFGTPGTENVLFLAYCFYEWNDAIDDFGANYAEKIAQCREKWMVMQYVAEQQAAADL